MQKLNGLGVNIQSLKKEMLNADYPEIVKKALRDSAEIKVKNKEIDVELHLALTDENLSYEEFTQILLENKDCLKSHEEMLVDFEKIRETIQEQLDADEIPTGIITNSLVDEEKISFTKTFKLDKLWVAEYFGEPAEEVSKLMVRNGFVEKFAVLRLSKILKDFLKDENLKKDDLIECKATRVFYDVEGDYYGIHLMFYLDIEAAENDENIPLALAYIHEVHDKAVEFVEERMKI